MEIEQRREHDDPRAFSAIEDGIYVVIAADISYVKC